jgi:regulator of protease activity HflC (stomatin/prohibitin superfamily)
VTKSKVLDKDGIPIIVSAILNHRVRDPVKYQYNIENPLVYLENQVSAVIKDIASNHQYLELKTEAENITMEATSKIQDLSEACGIRVERLNLSDLSYAPEIAQQMLVKQQAMAHIEARKMIVDSSISIVNDILKKMHLDEEAKNKAAVNLLTVLVSNTGAQNVVNLN